MLSPLDSAALSIMAPISWKLRLAVAVFGLFGFLHLVIGVVIPFINTIIAWFLLDADAAECSYSLLPNVSVWLWVVMQAVIILPSTLLLLGGPVHTIKGQTSSSPFRKRLFNLSMLVSCTSFVMEMSWITIGIYLYDGCMHITSSYLHVMMWSSLVCGTLWLNNMLLIMAVQLGYDEMSDSEHLK